MTQDNQIAYYEYPRPVFSILIFIVLVLYFSFELNFLVLASIPSIYLGLVASNPNFNLVTLFFPILVAIVGTVVSIFQPEIGYIISASVFPAWLVGSAEKALRQKPVYHNETTENN